MHDAVGRRHAMLMLGTGQPCTEPTMQQVCAMRMVQNLATHDLASCRLRSSALLQTRWLPSVYLMTTCDSKVEHR